MIALLAAMTALPPNSLLACAVCMGGSSGGGGTPIGPAVNAAIFMLLTVVLSIGACFFAFLRYLAKREKLAPLQPSEQVPAGMLTSLDEGEHHA